MGSHSQTVRVAVTQHEPVWLDLQGTITKTVKIIEEARKAGAKLVAFPEVWVPGYPAVCEPFGEGVTSNHVVSSRLKTVFVVPKPC